MLLVLISIIFIVALYYYATRNHDYWAKRNVKHDPPIPFFGNHLRNVLCMKSITLLSKEYYNKYPNEKVVGYYRGNTPELIIRDLDIARVILNVDFPFFYPRGLGRNPEKEPLQANLFSLDGDSWKLLRQKLTPAFTTAKLKKMFPLIIACAEKLQILCTKIADRGGECDIRDVMARFTTEFIGSCGFGIDMDTISNENSYFRNMGKRMFHRTISEISWLALWELVPELRNYIKITDPGLEQRFSDLVAKITNERNNKPIGRNDFIDLLLELQTKEIIVGESLSKRNPDGTPAQVELKLDSKLMTAQVFVFFGAGFETSSSATSFTLHKLAFDPEFQEKIQDEIDEVLAQYDNKLSYDSVSQLSLLDMAFKESLRMFPSLGILNRECAKPYTIPGLDIKIDPGVKIIIPIEAIQNDEKYFENPNKYDPLRFSPGNGEPRNKYSYMPFGEGPRACIGARLGQMQSIAGLAAVLQKFTVEPSKATKQDIQVDSRMNIVQAVKGGLPLHIKLRKPKTE